MYGDKDHIITLISGYLTGTLSEKEQEELTAWIEANAENRMLFERLVSRDTFLYKRELYQKIQAEKALQTFQSRTRKQRFIKRRNVLGKYAAGIALIILTGVTTYLYYASPKQPDQVLVEKIATGSPKAILLTADGQSITLEANNIPATRLPSHVQIIDSATQLVYTSPDTTVSITRYHELQVPRGGEYKLRLPDGTFVYLNSATRLKFPVSFAQDKREVYLSGEAYFEVSKDTSRPFYVLTDNIRVKVYGTTFNVNTQDKDFTRTVLAEGKIGINAIGQHEDIILHPDQSALFNKQNGSISVQNVNARQYTAWKDGLFLFENEPLEKIMDKLSLWYDINVFYANESVRKICFTGYMKRYEQIDLILKAIQSTVSVSFEIKNKTITVYEKINKQREQ